jgi:uncharacterized protein YraI
MSHAQLTFPRETPGSPWRGGWRILVVVAVLALLTGGGWWAYDAGLLDRFWGQVTETAIPVTGQSETGQPQGAISAPPGVVDTATAGVLPADPAAAGADMTASEASAPAQTAASSETAGSATPATAPVSIPAIAGVKGVQLWDSSGNLLATFDSGARLTATGRSADGAWLAVQTAAGEGWVQTGEVIAYDVQALLVVTPPDGIVPPEQQATAATTTNDTPVETVLAANLETASPLETATLKATVSTTGAQLNVRAGPGTEHLILAKAGAGDDLVVLGRNAAGDWLQIQLVDTLDGFGWVAAQYVQVSGDASTLPVSEAVAAAQALVGDTSTVSPGTSANGTAVAASGQTVAATAASATGLQGTLVFQQSIGGMIYAYDLATGELWPLTYGADPAISPDGSTVAFVRDGGENGLYLIDIDGNNERLIFAERNRLSSPKWSPDGQWLVFSRGDEYMECYDLGRNQCLTAAELSQRFPNGLPDDLDAPLVKQYSYKLAVVDANGQNYHDIASLNSAKAPDWSEGGIVYQSTAGLQRTADTADAVNQLVAFDYLRPYYYDPDWQPGSGQLAFQVKGAAQWEIYVVNPDGSGMTALTRPVTTLVNKLPSNVAPAYSPDGQHIVFLSNRSDNHEAGAWRLWVMNADGSDQRPLPIELAIEYTYGLEQVVSWGRS